MWRDGGTSSAQIKFQEALGRIVADMSARERAAVPQRQETLGWTIVGRLLAADGYRGHIQQQLGAAVRDTGVMAAMLETDRPSAQESLGSAVLVASAAQAAALSGETPSTGVVSTHEIPYPAGVILLAGFFVLIWGLRSVAETGPGLIAQEPARPVDEPYRKAG
jgi:hypothetical protein